MTKPALLMLDDGACFTGEARGACREAAGEVVFTTGMSGYQETLSDPSFLGQIVTFTAAHVGNYGVCPQDSEYDKGDGGAASGETPPRPAGAVFHDLFEAPPGEVFPHWRAAATPDCPASLDSLLARQGITAITGVDTRALTLHLREHGARNGILSALDLDRPALLRRAKELPPMRGRDLASPATCAAPYHYVPRENLESSSAPLRVIVLDYGVKRSIPEHLAALGLSVDIWPAWSGAEDILAAQPDGVLLSNGPGDPEACSRAVDTLRRLIGRVPLFGICLGHQLLALALGAKTYKLPFGHHGCNHPVKETLSGRVYITSQNHGFCVDPDSLPPNAMPTHWNCNDGTLEGLELTDLPVFSVQFHPEAAPGPTDAAGLFRRFAGHMVRAAMRGRSGYHA